MEDNSPHKIIRKEICFRGHVQGVGFRYRAKYAAGGCGVTGWVKNEWDGTVVMEAQGTREQLDLLVQKLRTRNFIRIDYAAELEIPLVEELGFHVR